MQPRRWARSILSGRQQAVRQRGKNETDHDVDADAVVGNRFDDDGADDANDANDDATKAQTDNEHNLRDRRQGAGVGSDRKPNEHNLQ
jgi:hypothetical protein